MIAVADLLEYGEAEVALDPTALVPLQTAARGALGLSPGTSVGSWLLRAGSRVGTIVTPNVRVLIRPKVPAANLFYMLEADGEALPLGQEQFEYHTGGLVPAFATFFVRHLERALARGLVRSHVEWEERLAGVRGRVLLRSQQRSGGLPLPVECSFDEHTLDTRLNRIVAGAAARLLRLPGVAPATRTALLQALSCFDGVSAVALGDTVRPTEFTRLDAHFGQVERLARLVLDAVGLRNDWGGAGAATFLLDMNHLFEAFVESRIGRYLRGRVQVRRQHRAVLDRDRQVRIQPDLVLFDGDTVVHVADAKYKLTSDGLGREADYYQLLAYCIALGVQDGTLIYCQGDGPPPARTVFVESPSGEVRLASVAVSLAGSPAELERQMALLADGLLLRHAQV